MSLGQIAGLGIVVGTSTVVGYNTGGTGGAVCGFIGSVSAAIAGTQLTGNGNEAELTRLRGHVANTAAREANTNLTKAINNVNAKVKTAVDAAIAANSNNANRDAALAAVVTAAETAANNAVRAQKARRRGATPAGPLHNSPAANKLNSEVEKAGAAAYAERRLLSKRQPDTELLSNAARDTAKGARKDTLILEKLFAAGGDRRQLTRLGFSNTDITGAQTRFTACRNVPMTEIDGHLFQTHTHHGRDIALGRSNTASDITINDRGVIRTINPKQEEQDGYVNFARNARIATFPALFSATMLVLKATGIITGGAALGFATAILWPTVIVAGLALLAFAGKSYTHYNHTHGDKSMVMRQTARIILTPVELLGRGVAAGAAAVVIILNLFGAEIGDPYRGFTTKADRFYTSIG